MAGEVETLQCKCLILGWLYSFTYEFWQGIFRYDGRGSGQEFIFMGVSMSK